MDRRRLVCWFALKRQSMNGIGEMELVREKTMQWKSNLVGLG